MVDISKVEATPDMTIAEFYEEYVRKKAGHDFARKEMLAWEKTDFALSDEKTGEMVPTIPLDSTVRAVEKYHAEKWEPLTVAWLARQAGMDRERFIRNILPKLKRYDKLRSKSGEGILAGYGI